MSKGSIKQLLAVVLALMPVLLYYDFPFTDINIGTISCFACFFLFLIQGLFKKNMASVFQGNVHFLLLILYFLISTLSIGFLSRNNNVVTFLFVLFNMFSVLFIWNDSGFFDKKTFIKTYKVVASFSILFYFIQIAVGVLFHRILPGKIPFIPLTESYSGIQTSILRVGTRNVLVYCYSIFSEQSHFSVYLLPLFHLLLIEDKRSRFRVLKVILVAVSILLTNSANGIIGLLIIFFLDILVLNKKRRGVISPKLVVKVVFYCIIAILVYFLLNSIPYFNSMFSRLFSDSGSITSKAGYRIFRGFYIIGTLPLKNLLFGLGYLQLEKYVVSYGVFTPFDISNYTGSALEYTNFICQIVLYFGICGLVLFVLSVIKFARHKQLHLIAFLICLIALWFSSSMLFEQNFLFFMTFIVSLSSISIKTEVRPINND